MNNALKAFWSVLISDKVGSRFLIAVIGSVAFSVSIILSTIGLMDGFQDSLSSALRKSLGDVAMTHRNGLFRFDRKVKDQLSKSGLYAYTSAYQVEGFLMTEKGERGVRILSIRPESYLKVTGNKIVLKAGELAIGSELAKSYKLSGGDEVDLAFVSSNSSGDILPIIHSFIVKQVVHHEVFEKDSRMVYADREYIESIGLSSKDNIIFGLFSKEHLTRSQLDYKEWELRKELGKNFKVRLYGGEYQSLLHAVEIEKRSISIILQIIVLVAVFNIAAFVTFISEKKSKDFFLLRALGVPFKKICMFWISFITALWAVSCIVAIGFTNLFNFLLTTLPWFKFPGKIYVLSQLQISLTIDDYLLVFAGSAAWIFLIGSFSLLRISQKGLLGGLREEFS